MVLSSQALQIKEVHLAGLYTNQNFYPMTGPPKRKSCYSEKN